MLYIKNYVGSYVDVQATLVGVGFDAVEIGTFEGTDVFVDGTNVVF